MAAQPHQKLKEMKHAAKNMSALSSSSNDSAEAESEDDDQLQQDIDWKQWKDAVDQG